MEGSTQFKATADDVSLTHGDQRSHNFNSSFLGACANNLVKRLVIRRAAIRITRTVLFHCPDVDFFRAEHFRPTYGNCEKVCIAEGDIRDRNVLPNGM